MPLEIWPGVGPGPIALWGRGLRGAELLIAAAATMDLLGLRIQGRRRGAVFSEVAGGGRWAGDCSGSLAGTSSLIKLWQARAR